MATSGHEARFNFEGYLTNHRGPKGTCQSYAQWFRNGAFEAAQTRFTSDREGRKLIRSVAYEKDLIEAVMKTFRAMRELGINPPVAVMISMIGVRGVVMAMDRFMRDDEPEHPIDRDVLRFPEIVVENFTHFVPMLLKPAFDAVWQACGYRGSHNYNDQGVWVEQRR